MKKTNASLTLLFASMLSLANITWCPAPYRIHTTKIQHSFNALLSAKVLGVEYASYGAAISAKHALFDSAQIIHNGQTLRCFYRLGGGEIFLDAGGDLSKARLKHAQFLLHKTAMRCSGARMSCLVHVN
ncbi:MAG: hypothetical protein COV52_03780 [Gammaproteobacteria bacterium CG11_big_fil_rev_8_21_14_0_20_46_22]|nr:MAG: hypothetical protein COW05_01830 [Gammaproteobacteria bacterium CG12_big_fil_rev_8_21_14_0_65_46_12]PIR11440.1 MAG: hypothetical protein COV52_03780 [Gammaproteobacteria bacterium CG11_big_fil_rev_8_21_14_0_20_46_22]